MAPVHLALLTRASFEAYEGALTPFFTPRVDGQFQLRVAAVISADANLVQQFAGVVNAGFPSFPQEGAVRIDLAGRRVLSFVWLRRLHKMLAHGLAIEVKLRGDRRHRRSEEFSTGAFGEFSTGADRNSTAARPWPNRSTP
jgi:hypothetical protein